MRIPWANLLRRVRITGISAPLGGVQWTLDRSEQEKARRLIIFLEDRRVLYNAYEFEVPESCFRSVTEIRRYLVDALQEAKPREQLAISLHFMLAACRKFLDDTGGTARWGRLRQPLPKSAWEAVVFNGHLGMLRGAFGFHLCLVAGTYQIDVGANLSTILPALPDDWIPPFSLGR